MADPNLHIVKLAAGIQEMSQLEARVAWTRSRARAAGLGDVALFETRNTPRREGVENGSLYCIFAHQIQCRQKIPRIEETTGSSGGRRCLFHLDPEIGRTRPVPRRAFQGWRYLDPGDAPADIATGPGDATDELPDAMREELSRLGIR